ncbi:hypothetical protein TRAPUB_3097 [Trametes pubescens]|uniref:Uncharacterized protein n=1 Tax=Trametes pubescens TaxID=154538 RepID=A0A1M2VET6_TRAPU|nr:hypothetical protein TRAPUB_3097 [Trametes pubescens]
MDHVLAPLDSRVHDVAGSDLAPSTGSLHEALPRAGNRDMLHRMVPVRKSTYSSLAGAVASPAFVPTTPHANPPVVNKNEGDHFDRTVAPGAGARYGRAVDDAFRAHDYKGRNSAEPRDHDARPFPSHNIYYQATLQDRSPVGVLAETTRLATPAPPPILAHENHARSAPTYWTSHPSKQHAGYSRFERNTESYGPSYLEATSQQRLGDIVVSDAAPPYTSSPSSSQSSIAAPVQLSAHQHQVVSVPSAGFLLIPNLSPPSRVELNTSQAGVLDQATAYDQSFGDNVREAYLHQGWQMANHDAGAFAPEQPTGLNYSDMGLYSQDAYTHCVSASSYAQDRGVGCNPNEPQFPAELSADRQREHAFATQASSQYDRQGESRRTWTAPIQRRTPAVGDTSSGPGAGGPLSEDCTSSRANHPQRMCGTAWT